MPEELLSPQDLADLCQVLGATVYRWNHCGYGPSPLRIGRHVRYRPSDVDVWLQQQQVKR